jgi:hypothetical protein
MGGFAFDTSDAKVNFLPNGRTRLTVTPKGLKILQTLKPSLVPNMSKEHIEDKSNANGLAKALVCLQATWFCIQCITRLAQGLPVCLLELNTFGHAVCALFIYLLWWDKPLDVEEPTLIQGRESHELCALMCMSSVIDGRYEYAAYEWFRYSTSPVSMLRGESGQLRICFRDTGATINLPNPAKGLIGSISTKVSLPKSYFSNDGIGQYSTSTATGNHSW